MTKKYLSVETWENICKALIKAKVFLEALMRLFEEEIWWDR